VSFTGELSYEINVPASRAPEIWEALMNAGTSEGLQPLGMDALKALRLEKGFLHIGADTDGTTIPDDVGWGITAANKRADYIGKRSLSLPENRRPDRLQLVGLSQPHGQRFVVGSHLRIRTSDRSTDGWVTSAGVTTFSQEPIALAMLRGGRALLGEWADLHDNGHCLGRARVVDSRFFDAGGERMNA
jgi:sarcosine oxidase subunit alpha